MIKIQKNFAFGNGGQKVAVDTLHQSNNFINWFIFSWDDETFFVRTSTCFVYLVQSRGDA